MRYIFGDYVLDTQRHELHHQANQCRFGVKSFRYSCISWRIAIG